jgi:hypothetical protein
MKINKLYIAFFILATSLFVACSEYTDTVVPSPTVSADNPAVRFGKSNKIKLELDPSNLTFTVAVRRSNATAALEVPVTVLADTAKLFTVPAKLSFPAGVDSVNLQVSMNSSAPTGVPINLQLAFEYPNINPYLATGYPIYSSQVTVVKWNNLGTVQFYDSFSFYHVAEVTLEQRDDVKTMYRITSPYKEDILLDAEWEGWIGGMTQEKIVFTVKGSNVTWDKFWYTNLLYNGNAGQEIKAYLPSAISKTGDAQSIVVKNSSGNIQYFKLYPYFYIDGVGGWGLKPVYVGFPGYDLAGALGLGVFGK